ncbi:sigma-70 family RNA polymerase sigma factor [Aquidulcibacter paucihalophilus]|uniref:sigma-70 family RNA polymerase sigma factor n=1 Tax=Aquidulcibacter paucihalophilus TaxID=1978549 RepID=UPI000A192D51|nr:sigma-70 family RNA polymerase sigma factor [Aquidulcibacter paucihalophilus]
MTRERLHFARRGVAIQPVKLPEVDVELARVLAAEFASKLVLVIPPLRAFARGLCGRADLADDLAQEALAKAWAARASYLPNTNFKAWIFTILRNHYYSWCRKQRRVAPWDPDAADKLLVCEPAQQGHMALAELAAGLQSLPAQQREALILVGAGGFAYEEAAQIIGCAVGTVKSRVARGRAFLRDFVDDRQRDLSQPRPTSAQASEAILGELRRLDPNRP